MRKVRHTTFSKQPITGVPEQFHELAEFAMLASQPDPFDPMDRAIRKLGDEALQGTEHLHASWKVVREYPLAKSLLAISEVWASPDSSTSLSLPQRERLKRSPISVICRNKTQRFSTKASQEWLPKASRARRGKSTVVR